MEAIKKRNIIRRIIYFSLLLFVSANLIYSFKQYAGAPLDGDMADGIVPGKGIQIILNNPLGINAIVHKQNYANPNRFFSHFMFKKYFNWMPLLLQKMVTPIDSVYLSCAIAKIIMEIGLIVLLAMCISGTQNILKLDFMLATALIIPLFQANGDYCIYMGIIDRSITYSFFYALPLLLLLLYLFPFINQYYHDKKNAVGFFRKILGFFLAVVICLSGPLNTGIILVFSILVIGINFKKNYFQTTQKKMLKRIKDAFLEIPKKYWFYLLPISILSLYSLYLGTYNSITIESQMPLWKLFSLLPLGIYYQFTQKLAFPILFGILILNAIFIRIKFNTDEGKKIIKSFQWILLFSLVYILLLPFGGYRIYRPYLLRYDTIMPITLGLMFLFGISTLFLLKQITTIQRVIYLPIIVAIFFVFIKANAPEFDDNYAEKMALQEMSTSKNTIVTIPANALVLSWLPILKPEDSELKAQLLYDWHITKEKKIFYNKIESK